MSSMKYAESSVELNKSLKIIRIFAQYGFRKTSMNDIAEAAGLSRQSIYNQFGSKESVFDWAIENFMKLGLDSVDVALADPNLPAISALVKSHQGWIGDHVAIWNGTPHGSEMLAMWTDAKSRMGADYSKAFVQKIEAFLVRSNLCKTEQEATEHCFVLKLIVLGLMRESKTAEEFEQGLNTAVSLLFTS